MSDGDPAQNQPPGYVPPKVWTWDQPSGGTFASINRPVSGATHEKPLPIGRHKLQLYSMGTPMERFVWWQKLAHLVQN